VRGEFAQEIMEHFLAEYMVDGTPTGTIEND
jgi:hypothetical protein